MKGFSLTLLIFASLGFGAAAWAGDPPAGTTSRDEQEVVQGKDERLFSHTLDFRENLAIGAVVHKAYVDVNEKGTEAAAATGVRLHPRDVSVQEGRQPVTFRADHPFVFVLRENHTGSILFIGRVSDPS